MYAWKLLYPSAAQLQTRRLKQLFEKYHTAIQSQNFKTLKHAKKNALLKGFTTRVSLSGSSKGMVEKYLMS